jgi:hypothetical protein
MKKLFLAATLVLLAVAVIGFLIIPPGGSIEAARHALAENEVNNISLAIDSFYKEYNSFPQGSYKDITSTLSGKNNKGIIFLELPSHSLGPNKEYLDPWGTPYQICYSASSHPHVFSLGRRLRDSSDDIQNQN